MSKTQETPVQVSPGTPTEPGPSRVRRAAELADLAQTEPLRAAEEIMALLRSTEGCPWDREQTFDSIRRHTLEEVYEVFEAIEERDWAALQDELGDLLLQVLFYAQMAKEEQRFALADVARSLNAKLIRRHPHIFADTSVSNSAEVKQNWDAIKLSEKPRRPVSEDEVSSVLTEVSRRTPALMEAGRLGAAAAKLKFDWPETSGVFNKVREELSELEAACSGSPDSTRAAIEEELGDVLFTVANVARHLGVDPELSLRAANAKFRRRFAAMEESARSSGAPLPSRTPAELEELWGEAKRLHQQERKTENRA